MFKLIRYDIRHGIREAWKTYLVTALFAVFIFICFFFEMVHMSAYFTDSITNIRGLDMTLGDAILLELGGCIPPAQNNTEGFSFPTIWFLVNSLFCYITLQYTVRDLQGGGIQVLTRTQNKFRWWASKCVLNSAAIFLCYAILYLVLTVGCCLCGCELTLFPNGDIFQLVFGSGFADSESSQLQLFLGMIAAPYLVTACLSLVQMTLTLFMSPAAAYIIPRAYVLGSIWVVSPVFLANYGMPVRSAAVGIYNFSFGAVLTTSVIVSAVAVLVGMLRVYHMDII